MDEKEYNFGGLIITKMEDTDKNLEQEELDAYGEALTSGACTTTCWYC